MGPVMSVLVVVVLSAALGAAVAGALAWFLPNFDPAAPKASIAKIAAETEMHPRVARYLRSRVDPARLTGLALTIALVILLGGAVAIGALLEMVRHNAGLAGGI